eukprot:1142918-Pelagomonas_calceolata.AAC.3
MDRYLWWHSLHDVNKVPQSKVTNNVVREADATRAMTPASCVITEQVLRCLRRKVLKRVV